MERSCPPALPKVPSPAGHLGVCCQESRLFLTGIDIAHYICHGEEVSDEAWLSASGVASVPGDALSRAPLAVEGHVGRHRAGGDAVPVDAPSPARRPSEEHALTSVLSGHRAAL